MLDYGDKLNRRLPSYKAIGGCAGRQISNVSILVAHSGSGGLVPSVAEAAADRVASVIFVDAILPHPGRSWFETAPAELASAIRQNAENGRAPKWPFWMAEPKLARLVADAGLRAELVQTAPRVPIAYLEAVAPNDCSVPPLDFAYLQLSSVYEDEAVKARGLDWTFQAINGDHLFPLTHPKQVADALISIATV